MRYSENDYNRSFYSPTEPCISQAKHLKGQEERLAQGRMPVVGYEEGSGAQGLMDIKAITGALIEALARYSEIKNTDRYKSLPASVRDETISDELSGDIRTLLAAQPEFGADRIVDTGLASVILAPALVRMGLNRGATAAVESLQKILNTTKAKGIEVQTLYGIRVASVTALVDGINLIPLDALPDSRQKQGLLERPSVSPFHPPPFHWFISPSAALTVPVEAKQVLVKSDTAESLQPNARVDRKAKFEDIRHCLAISHGEPIVAGPSWFQYDDSDFEEAAIARYVTSFAHQEVLPMMTHATDEMDLEQATEVVPAYYALDKVARRKVRTAMERVHLAFIRGSPADKALELAIALEALLIDSRGANSFKISLRAALLTAEDIKTRATNRAIIHATYTLRNQLVHSGESKSEVTVNGEGQVPSRDVAKRATAITINAIQSVLTAGKLPDWSDVELSPKGTSTG